MEWDNNICQANLLSLRYHDLRLVRLELGLLHSMCELFYDDYLNSYKTSQNFLN